MAALFLSLLLLCMLTPENAAQVRQSMGVMLMNMHVKREKKEPSFLQGR